MVKKESALLEEQLPVTANQEVGIPNGVEDFDNSGPTGLEKATARDQLIPRLTILQALSPQLEPSRSTYIDGAQRGDICDVGTGELFDQPLIVLPCCFDKVWIEWAPRQSGQGLVGIHPNDDIMYRTHLNEKKQSVLENGNLIQETAQWYCLNLSAGRRPCFIPFVSTQLKKSRKWVTLAKGERVTRKDGTEFNPPVYFRTYHLSTAIESNNQGNWHGWIIERGKVLFEYSPNWKALLDDAKSFQKSVLEGMSVADTSGLAEEGMTIDASSAPM